MEWMALCNLGNLFRIYLRQLTERTKKPPSHLLAFDWSGPLITGFRLVRENPTLFIFMVSPISSEDLDILRSKEQIKSSWRTSDRKCMNEIFWQHSSPLRFSDTRMTNLWTDPAFRSPREVQQASRVWGHTAVNNQNHLTGKKWFYPCINIPNAYFRTIFIQLTVKEGLWWGS